MEVGLYTVSTSAPSTESILLLSGNLYGRGASDNKAPVLAWMHAVEAYQALNIVRNSTQDQRAFTVLTTLMKRNSRRSSGFLRVF